MNKRRKLIIFGTEDFAQIAFEYFTHDSEYEVVAFAVDRAYLNTSELCGLPVVAFEDVQQRFSVEEHDFYVAIVYGKLNRLRQEVCERVKAMGYKLASYVSSRAFVWHNVELGEHCFIFESNTIQPFVKVGDNVVIWGSNAIGHHSTIGNHCFLTSAVVVSGWCSIGDYTFVGVNSSLANNTHIGEACWIGHGAVLAGDIPAHSLVKPVKSEVVELNEAVLFRRLARLSASR